MKYFLITITVLTFGLFVAFPSVDIFVSDLFYIEGKGFIYRYHIISQMLYVSIRILTGIVLSISFYIVFVDFIKNKNIEVPCAKYLFKIREFFRFTWQQAIYLISVILITPGIVVHWIGKPLWDRGRPVNITEFGGEKQFTPIYEIMAGQNGNSFPSGHASMSFAFIALIYLFKENRKLAALVTITYAILGSLCRVWQGGHYLSDVSVSAVITLWTIYLCKIYILENKKLQNL